jgi:uncharacterized protein YfaS (alpha-2-macroglobulin family)
MMLERIPYHNKEIRGDSVAFFITDFSNGRHRIAYMARAISAGRFLALPVQSYAMHDASLWGRSGSGMFVGE